MPSNLDQHILISTQRLLKKSLRGYRVTIPNKPLSKIRHATYIDVPAKSWLRVHKQITWTQKELGTNALTGKPIKLQYTAKIDTAITLENGEFQIWWLDYPPSLHTIPNPYRIDIQLPDAFNRITNYIKSHIPKNE